jgi:hypothetical protein
VTQLLPPSSVNSYLNFDTLRFHYGNVLQWGDGKAANGIKNYLVKRNGLTLATVSNNSYSDFDIANGQKYSYDVYTVDKTGKFSAATNYTRYVRCNWIFCSLSTK